MIKAITFSLLVLLFCNSKTGAQINGIFTVGGSIDLFYPVVFLDGAWGSNRSTELTIGRENVHQNSDWRGSIIANFKYHQYNWGHGSDHIIASIFSNSGEFIAGWADGSEASGSGIIIWLKGGGTTYQYSSAFNVSPTVYDNSTGYNEPNLNVPGGILNRLPKSQIDSYVNSKGYNFTSTTTIGKNPINFTSIWENTPDKNNNISEISNDVDSYKRLMIVGNSSNGGGIRRVGIWDRLSINNAPFSQALNVGGGAYISEKVRIGTTDFTGNYQLAVEGIIGARKLKITQSSWADHVFKKGYKLKPILEVEKFIQLNHHLPDVPKAEDIVGKDLDISENQVLLLKKIEELTLYMIELKKENDLLNAQIIKQNERLEKIELKKK